MKCEYCASDFVRKETYKAHIISHHKRHLTEQEFEDVIEKIRRFQAPSLDINQFTLEKQNLASGGTKQLIVHEVGEDGEIFGEMEIIDEKQGEDDDVMVIEHEGDYYEESELYEDEQ